VVPGDHPRELADSRTPGRVASVPRDGAVSDVRQLHAPEDGYELAKAADARVVVAGHLAPHASRESRAVVWSALPVVCAEIGRLQ
jgi:hypothetical protein